ncbi:MAG: ABC transporter ATP-binding protein [Planctomycetes bacterium]|nr:ABC transporter ATP-binding protein [Planctomycetota bacterium]
MNHDPIVAASDVWFAYDGQPVLREVSFTIRAGERVCVVGPNGGGKTTLLKLMLGLLEPTRGELRIFGEPPGRQQRRVGYTPQHSQFDAAFPVSVLDVVLMGRLGRTPMVGPYRRADRAAAADALAEVGLADLRRRPFSALSGGQRQRVLIARALASEPELLLLDEPTANLDVGVEQEFGDLLADLSERLTLVLVSHDIGFVAELVDKVVCVRGTVAIHATAELTGELMRDLYGHDVRLVRHDHNCLDCPRGEDRDG